MVSWGWRSKLCRIVLQRQSSEDEEIDDLISTESNLLWQKLLCMFVNN